MLSFFRSRKSRDCDGTTRRDFLRVGTLGLTGVMLPDLLRSRAAAASAGQPTRNTSVVWLWLSGGPTHVETFDPKMTAPAEFRSTTGAVQTRVPGLELGSSLPKMAAVADKMAFVRSFAHRNGGHAGGTHWVMTGYNFNADLNSGQSHPGIGAILARQRGPNNASTGVPTYVRTSNIRGDGPAWLGSSYAPFGTSGNARDNLNLLLSLERMQDRRHMLHGFDSVRRDIDRTGLVDGLDSFETQAYELITGRAREVFDTNQESQATRNLYGNSALARQMLLARRLCEAGSGFVTVSYGGWDMHGQIAQSMGRRAPELDHAVNAFVQDVHERGLQNDILLVISGEFGRTPRVNRNAGRDHWPNLSTLALSGGGLRMGQAVGESSAKAEVPKSRPITPQDLMATVFHVLGMPRDLHFNSPQGRPTPMIDSGRAIAELV
jgi:hypothetical protein